MLNEQYERQVKRSHGQNGSPETAQKWHAKLLVDGH